MPEALTFANYRIDTNGVEDIYKIGTEDNGTGVIQEMASAFGHELTETPTEVNLGELIGKVGPAKELQENISGVQEALGTTDDAVTIARSWAERSGLLVPVERSYVNGGVLGGDVWLSIITGGVRNWMSRRADRLIDMYEKNPVGEALLVAGNRAMKPSEGEDVEVGMTEADYMRDVIARRLAEAGIQVHEVRVQSGIGDEVMTAGAQKAKSLVGRFSTFAVVSNAGAWVQNVGQMRRALISEYGEGFDFNGHQVLAVSDGFPLGTGSEPTSTHQNPFSATGQIVRNAQELGRNY